MHRWRYPSLSLHGIEGAFSDGGAKTVIPRKVIGKFSIRLVPDMDPKVVEKLVSFFPPLFSQVSGVTEYDYVVHVRFYKAFHFYELRP